MSGDLTMNDHNILDANTVQANTLEDPEDATLEVNDNLLVSGSNSRISGANNKLLLNAGGTDILQVDATTPDKRIVVNGNISINNGGATGTNVIKGLRILYAGDITNVSTASTTYETKKTAPLIFNSNYGLRPRYVNVILRLWNDNSGTATYANVSIENCNSGEVSVTTSTPTLKSLSIDVSSCSDGVYDLNLKLKTGNANYAAHNDLIDIYFVY